MNTGCGAADSGVGPFYCPEDDLIYIDVSFWNELATRFGADGEFAQPYVLAHEYGHHVQDLLGTEARVRRQMERDPARQNELSVALELQADCYAGVWTNHATQTTDASGRPIFTQLTDADIDQALEAAAAVGDDAIQKKMGGTVDESQFTHGSSEQRNSRSPPVTPAAIPRPVRTPPDPPEVLPSRHGWIHHVAAQRPGRGRTLTGRSGRHALSKRSGRKTSTVSCHSSIPTPSG